MKYNLICLFLMFPLCVFASDNEGSLKILPVSHIRPDGFGGYRSDDGTTMRPDGFGGQVITRPDGSRSHIRPDGFGGYIER